MVADRIRTGGSACVAAKPADLVKFAISEERYPPNVARQGVTKTV